MVISKRRHTIKSRTIEGVILPEVIDWRRVRQTQVKNSKPNTVYINENIGDCSRIADGSFLIYCKIGDDVEIGDGVRAYSLIAGDRTTIGDFFEASDNCNFGDWTIINSGYCILGDNVKFGKMPRFLGEEPKHGLDCECKAVLLNDNGSYSDSFHRISLEQYLQDYHRYMKIFNDLRKIDGLGDINLSY